MASQRSRNAPNNDTQSKPLLALDTICSTLKIAQADIIHAYLAGSRLWGTDNAQSDYDLYIVLHNKCPSVSSHITSKGFASVHSGNIDALLIKEEVYRERLSEGAVFDLLTLWISDQYCIKSTGSTPWKIDLDALEASVEKVLQRDVSMAQKHFEGGKAAKSKKVLVHTLRMVMMATQIVEDGSVSDWTCATEIHETLMNSYHLSTWDALKDEFENHQVAQLGRFRQALRTRRDAKR